MSNPAPEKSELRAQLRRRRMQLAPEERAAAARAAARNARDLPTWNTSQRIALYLPANGELDTGPLATNCRAQGKSLYLPVIRDDLSLQFALWVEDQDLVANRFGIPEPGEGSLRVGAADLDIVFMPLVGWDLVGHRLGMGGGFYDRTLAGVQGPVKVGLAYDCQRSERISPEPWDISMAFVVTETALYRCGATAAVADVSPG